MTSHSMAFRHESSIDLIFSRVSQFAARSVHALLDWAARDPEPRNAAELLEWADRYERTEPSYAAELRAVAQRHLR